MKKYSNIIINFFLCMILSCCSYNDKSSSSKNNSSNNNFSSSNTTISSNSDSIENDTIIKDEYLMYPESTKLNYIDHGSLKENNKAITNYNKDKWYYNDLNDLPLPDPFVYEENGTYYITGTNDDYYGDIIDIYTTTNFKDYQRYTAYTPSAQWEMKGADALIFAPEIFKYGEYYYLSYSNNAIKDNHRYITFVRSKSLMGPFEIIQDYNSKGEFVDGNIEPLFTYDGKRQLDVLDQHILIDDGNLYLYYTVYDAQNGEYIVGVKMNDPISADWETYKILIRPGELTPETTDTDLLYWETYIDYFPVVEAPFVIKNEQGIYYLTYSVNHYPNRYYSICYATSSSPLGDYEKPYNQNEPWSNLLFGYGGPKEGDLYDDYGGFMSGCGHHAFFKSGDQLMIVYHAHANHGIEITDNWMKRCVAFDYVYFDENGKLYCEGPTYSLQHLPESITGYKNIAPMANVKSINVTGTEKINDNYIVSNHNLKQFYENREVILGSDFSYILLEFDQLYEINGISIYNSSKYEKMITEIEYINFFNNNVIFNSNFPLCYYDDYKEFIFPTSAFTMEFENIVTDKVLICFNILEESQINEIKIYGKSL